ncbi:UNVERIFIED_CONTAM: hypothetical protein Scaly_1662800 [Sesamum calycinum]|uniref:Uncharacterized protein n=1 Tax=Sesamum calycinum TaxID=2727403 RepID=A0AAW2NSV2_9LAMI
MLPLLSFGPYFSWMLIMHFFMDTFDEEVYMDPPEGYAKARPDQVCSLLLSWKTKKQTTVSRSSVEAQYRSTGSTILNYLLTVFHERTKHLDIDCYLVHDQFKLDFISPFNISGSDQPADQQQLLCSWLVAVQPAVGFPSSILRGGCYISVIISADFWALTKKENDAISI